MSEALQVVALVTGLAGLAGALANAVITLAHCRRDKTRFEEIEGSR